MPGGHDIAISVAMAKKHFGNENPIGKIFRVSEELDVKVTGVFQNVTTNSSLQFDFVLPFSTYRKKHVPLDGWELGKYGKPDLREIE